MPATLTPVSLRFTPEEYFDWEETQEEKHDYVYGEVFAMSGSTEPHNIIAGNFFVALHRAFAGTDCTVYNEGMRVQVEKNGRYTYPDVSAVCGDRAFSTPRRTPLTNPSLIVEVLSDRTEGYDRGDKLAAYRGVPSIQEIVLVRQDRRAVEVYRREGEARWTAEDLSEGPLALASVNAEVSFDELYAGTNG